MNKIKVNENVIFGADKLVITAGPCAIEEDISITLKTAEELKKNYTRIRNSIYIQSVIR